MRLLEKRGYSRSETLCEHFILAPKARVLDIRKFANAEAALAEVWEEGVIEWWKGSPKESIWWKHRPRAVRATLLVDGGFHHPWPD